MFDLEKSIAGWLRKFRKHSSFEDASISEMESHLRDHIEDLTSDGHTEQEAFELATKEFGEIPSVAEEEQFNRYKSLLFPELSLFLNNLRIGLRNITKRPFYTFLNTFGLAVGVSGVILIGLYVHDELSFDRMFPESDRIFRINIDNRTNGEYSEYATAPGPMANVLVQDCPAVELVSRFRNIDNALIKRAGAVESVKTTEIVAVDSGFLDMFGVSLLYGEEKSALSEPNTLILTETAAKVFFDKEIALGQSVIINEVDHYIVSGVIEDFPKNSFLRNHQIFLSLSSFKDAQSKAWNTWYFPTFVRLQSPGHVVELQAFLNTVKDNYLIPWAMTFIPGLTVESSRQAEAESGNFMRFNTTALTDIRLYSGDRRGEFSSNGTIRNVYIMVAIGIMLLILAAVNFTNLTIAFSLKRVREVGIRKALGSSRLGLVRQFLTESTLIALFSMLLGVFLAILFIPFFNLLSDKALAIPFTSPIFWTVTLVAVVLLGLISGFFPSLYMARLDSIKALKGQLTHSRRSPIQNGLVIFQFFISVFLIACTGVVYQQVNYIGSKELGFDRERVLIIEDVNLVGSQLLSLKESIKGLSAVNSVSLSSYLPTPSKRGGTTYFVEGQMESGAFDSNEAMIIEQWDVDTDYIEALGLTLIAGRVHEAGRPADSLALVINKVTADMMGFGVEEVLGQRITDDFHRPDKENMAYYTIIGVVDDFHFESMQNKINGLTLRLGGTPDKMIIRLNTGDVVNSISQIENAWRNADIDQSMNFHFLDQAFENTYRSEIRLGKVFMTFTSLSVLIACLGLFGLATFDAENRTKEIGIRKVLGATVPQVMKHLSLNFLKLILVSIIISLPLSWLVMERWLQDFSYRTELSITLFIGAGLLAIVIALLTVGYQSIRSAIMNPVKSLRAE